MPEINIPVLARNTVLSLQYSQGLIAASHLKRIISLRWHIRSDLDGFAFRYRCLDSVTEFTAWKESKAEGSIIPQQRVPDVREMKRNESRCSLGQRYQGISWALVSLLESLRVSCVLVIDGLSLQLEGNRWTVCTVVGSDQLK